MKTFEYMFLILAFLVLPIAPARAQVSYEDIVKSPVYASVDELAPTQMEAGFANVERMLGALKDKAVKAKVSWDRYVEEVVKPEMQSVAKALPGIRDPQGKLRPVDGHHRVLLAHAIEQEMIASGYPDFELRLPIDVKGDYRGIDAERFARSMEDRGYGQFPQALRKLPAAERYGKLPASFGGILNSDLRAIMGDALFQAGVDTKALKPYTEFKMGEVLMERGFLQDLKNAGLVEPGATAIPAGIGRDPRATEVAVRKLLTDRDAAQRLLFAAAEPAKREVVEKALARAAAANGLPFPIGTASSDPMPLLPFQKRAAEAEELVLLAVREQRKSVARTVGTRMAGGAALSLGAAVVPHVAVNAYKGRPLTDGLREGVFNAATLKTMAGGVLGSLAGLAVRHPLWSLVASVGGATVGASLGSGQFSKDPMRAMNGAAGAALGALLGSVALAPIPGGAFVGTVLGGVVGQKGGEWLHDALNRVAPPALRGVPFLASRAKPSGA
jgi:hypothetical protein